jgi:hypothetical protein
MDQSIQVSLEMGKSTEQVSMHGLMALITKGSGTTIK